MTSRLAALVVEADDPPALARFWAGLLGWTAAPEPADGTVLLPPDGTGFAIHLSPARAPRAGLNQMHPDLTTTSPQDQDATVARALALGARHLDVGQRGDEGHVVLADPEGNELCVLEPGNAFLAGCPRLGALAGDGSQEVGYFWRDALGWPLVWDSGLETAVQSPHGGPKLTWGGETEGRTSGRLRLELTVAPGEDPQAEVRRLAALGATARDAPVDGVVTLTDPDGNAFTLTAGTSGP